MKELLLTLMLVAVLATAGWSSVLADRPEQIDSTVSHTVANPCTGDSITFSGTLHHVVRKQTDDSRLRLSLASNTQDVSGLGASDTHYQLLQAGDFTIDNPRGRHDLSLTEDFPVTSQGASSDFLLHLALRVTTDADEEVTVTVNGLSAECRAPTSTPEGEESPLSVPGSL
jgi:hypothetical protein